MDFSKILQVTAICLPVFAVMGLGKMLHARGWLNQDNRNAINRLIYYLALPALILNAVAQQRFSQFLNPALLLPGFAATACIAGLFMVIAKLRRYRMGLAAAFVFGTFWANITYMGFPLAKNAFGAKGLALAAVYNAFLMPAFIITGFALIGFYGSRKDSTWGSKLKETFTNPIIIAAFLGIMLASAGEFFRDPSGELTLSASATAILGLFGSFLQLIGSMGLPLALISIGAALHFGKIKEYRVELCMVVAGKLLIMPLLTLMLTRTWFSQAHPQTVAVGVLLAATPNAVASYVVAVKAGVDEGFMSSILVLSTALSTVTLPLWLYFVL